MRKIEYLHLARIIRARVNMARATEASTSDPETLRTAQTVLKTCEELAHEFARCASVARAQFLNLCGGSLVEICHLGVS